MKHIAITCLGLACALGFSPVSMAHDNHTTTDNQTHTVQQVFSLQSLLNQPIEAIWHDNAELTHELTQQGLLMTHVEHLHDMQNNNGIGGGDDENVLVDTADESDEIAQTIANLSEEVQLKEDKLAELTESLTEKPSSSEPAHLLALRPVANARVSSDYGYRYIFGRTQFHKGIDLAVPYGSPVYATGSGVVSYSGWMRGYGRIVEIDHGNGLKTRYAHNSRLRVSVGESVRADQHIADVGCSGRCTGPHVHYEVRENGKAVNPNIYLAMAPER